MEYLIAATLRITPGHANMYRVVYTVDYAVGGTIIPSTIQGHEQLTTFLRECQIASEVIDVIIRMVGSGVHYILDLSDRDPHIVETWLRNAGG